MTRESEYAWKAFEEISEMMNKEIKMATPYNNMDKRRKWEAKEKAVDAITKAFDLRESRGYSEKVKVLVSEIEKAQNY